MSSHYTHGSDESEQERLTGLNRRLNERCLAPADFRAGERVIDFGAGLGQFSRMIARATGVPVVAIERSREQIEEALRQATADGETNLLTMREGDVLSPPIREKNGAPSTLPTHGSFWSMFPIQRRSCTIWPAPCAPVAG